MSVGLKPDGTPIIGPREIENSCHRMQAACRRLRRALREYEQAKIAASNRDRKGEDHRKDKN